MPHLLTSTQSSWKSATFTALCNILFPTSRSLDHLIVSATTRVYVFCAKTHRDIVTKLRQLKTLQLAKTTVLGNQPIHTSILSIRPKSPFQKTCLPTVPELSCERPDGSFCS